MIFGEEKKWLPEHLPAATFLLFLVVSNFFRRPKDQKPRINPVVRFFQIGIGDVPEAGAQVQVGAAVAQCLAQAEGEIVRKNKAFCLLGRFGGNIVRTRTDGCNDGRLAAEVEAVFQSEVGPKFKFFFPFW